MILEEQFGPNYDVGSAALERFRRKARNAGSVAALPYDERQAYGAAVEAAVLAKHKALMRRGGESMPKANCTSGTFYSDGADIERAIRQQQRSALDSYASKVRRDRADEEWRDMYAAAMKEKRERLIATNHRPKPLGGEA